MYFSDVKAMMKRGRDLCLVGFPYIISYKALSNKNIYLT
jgi:hypothetical protein